VLTAAAACAQLWMLTNLKKWFHAFEHNYTHHLDVQDKCLFPLRAFSLPARRPVFRASRA
jgi:hypothetical protein